MLDVVLVGVFFFPVSFYSHLDVCATFFNEGRSREGCVSFGNYVTTCCCQSLFLLAISSGFPEGFDCSLISGLIFLLVPGFSSFK